jgi:hypothetical protein
MGADRDDAARLHRRGWRRRRTLLAQTLLWSVAQHARAQEDPPNSACFAHIRNQVAFHSYERCVRFPGLGRRRRM